jgi:hypothetical protein
MTTVINNPGANSSNPDTGNSFGMLMSLILFIVALLLLWYYGLPLLNRAVNTPTAPSVNVPEQVDVNVNAPQPS